MDGEVEIPLISLSAPALNNSNKNGLSDLIHIWHVDVTGPEDVLYSFVTLNSH